MQQLPWKRSSPSIESDVSSRSQTTLLLWIRDINSSPSWYPERHKRCCPGRIRLGRTEGTPHFGVRTRPGAGYTPRAEEGA